MAANPDAEAPAPQVRPVTESDRRTPPVTAAEQTAAGANAAPSPSAIQATDTVAQGARKIVARYLEQMRAQASGTRRGDDPEAVHDMRVAIRRLRAALRALRPGFPPQLRAHLNAELQWFGHLLGDVRDLDVQLEGLAHYAAAAPRGHRTAFAGFRAHLEHQRATRHAALLAGLESPRYERLLVRLARFAQTTPAIRGGTRASRERLLVMSGRSLRDGFRRLRKRARKIGATAPPEDLHELRIRAKRLRYLLEFLDLVIGKPGHRLVKRLVGLQDLLGTYHDRVVAAEFIRAYAESAGPSPRPGVIITLSAFAAEELRLAAEQQAGFRRARKRFARRKTRRDLRATLRHLGVESG